MSEERHSQLLCSQFTLRLCPQGKDSPPEKRGSILSTSIFFFSRNKFFKERKWRPTKGRCMEIRRSARLSWLRHSLAVFHAQTLQVTLVGSNKYVLESHYRDGGGEMDDGSGMFCFKNRSEENGFLNIVTVYRWKRHTRIHRSLKSSAAPLSQ